MPCIHSKPLTVPCQACDALMDTACRDMAVDILQGRYDLQGYTPAERVAQQKRIAHLATRVKLRADNGFSEG